jgi:Holliday junction resolvase
MTNSREKGKRGERDWRDFLRETVSPDAKRGQQFKGGSDSPDVECPGMEHLHCEVKNTERFQVYKFIAQAVAECGGKTPYVAMKSNHKSWLVVMRAEDWIKMVRKP